MKQTTMQFDKRTPQPVTIQRLQKALDLMSAGHKATYALQSLNLTSHWSVFFEKTLIIRRVNGRKIEVLKPIIDRKDYSKLCKLRSTAEKRRRSKRNKLLINYTELPKADTDMLGLVNMPSNEPIKAKRSYNKRYPVIAKKAIALPWWKRFLLYLANH